jgi:hypothetical protein
MYVTDDPDRGNAANGADHRVRSGGRCWIRTSDPADVNRVL